ncbi:RNA polymerase recycling motor HelD [Ammoniphilus sp. CFH 90114]|uniref:RNA polymerase recycling motor HelD n=1 Tax=Ammoniphilus sp. CFH 90114 TaxID=2493665 RepID=UPI00100E7890|nr:RNA polymerase recycling motor HelD [Ammoniphilus sp. CFH 90114]RXT15322.1 helicase [Ammoniphilus sp. CFH 90114]
MSIEQQDWIQEQNRLKRVKSEIQTEMKRLEGIVEHRGSEVLDIRRNFWDEITVNLSNYDDVAETAASITQQQAVLTQQERSFRHAELTLHKLLKLEKTPYFARIDFSEKNHDKLEHVYIGIGSVVDEDTNELLVYDWRAPISGMFYDYTPGPAKYKTPEGEIEGEMALKRQYIIKNSQLEDMFDTGINIGDEMLQVMLAKNAHDKMGSIVMTIQQEQNQIIRDDQHRVLIVQGSAGSGKTSVALQRVAYLLYKYRNALDADQMLLFSPNSLFNDYVSNVLPELGEANMQQTTFQDHLDRGFDDEWTLEDAYDQLEYLLNGSEQLVDYQMRVKSIEWKTSIEFMGVMDQYIEHLKGKDMLFHDFTFKEKVLISKEELAELFYHEFGHDESISNRLDKVKGKVLSELEKIEQRVARNVYKRTLNSPKYLGSNKEMKEESNKKARKALAPLREKAKTLAFVDVIGMYKQLLTDEQWMKRFEGSSDNFFELAKKTINQLNNRKIPYEDATPMVYFQTAFKGFHTLNRIKQVIIDEAQDYSPFQLEYIRRLFPRAKFTLLGDLNQGIYYANVQSYNRIGQLFGEEDVKVMRLTKSYRSTDEIIEFSKRILRKPEPIQPIGRHGESPQIIAVKQVEQLAPTVAEGVRLMLRKGAESVAVICKTDQESAEVYRMLLTLLDQEVHLFTKKSRSFLSGVVVVPAYLAKGLEFDGVIVFNASRTVYEHDSERKLLYTACTRALHYLNVYFVGELSPLIGS